MFSRTENFQQYIKFYPVVSTIIALNVIIHVLPSFRFWVIYYLIMEQVPIT